MRRYALGARFVCALALGCVTAAPAFAQREAGPFGNLFGGQSTDRQQSLDLRGSLFGAYDDNVLDASRQTASVDPRFRKSGISGGGSGSLAYDLRGDVVRFALNGGTSVRQYAASSDLAAAMYQAGTSLGVKAAPRLDVDARANFAYSPFYQFAPFLEAGTPDLGPLTPGFGLAAIAERNTFLGGTIGLNSQFSARSGVGASVNFRESRLLDNPTHNVRAWGGQASFQHRLSRGLGLHLGYGRDRIEYAAADTPFITSESIDAGLDYGDTLSFARRTSLSFSTSTSAVHVRADTHFRLNGNIMLTRGFSRTWSGAIGYVRATEFIAGFRDPVLSDSVRASLGGMLARRVHWTTGLGYTRGAVGYGDSSRLAAYSGASKLSYGMTRLVGVYGQYSYYRYDIPDGSAALDFFPRFSRQAVSVGLTLWVPIINGTRAPRDTR
jgi:hypothetical protein